MELRSQRLYAHELQQLHQRYLRGQKLVDKLRVLGWNFDSNGFVVDTGDSLISKGRVRLTTGQVDAAMAFAFHLWTENKVDTTLLENIRVILLVLKREYSHLDYGAKNRKKICANALRYTSTHKERVNEYKQSMAQKRAVIKKTKSTGGHHHG